MENYDAIIVGAGVGGITLGNFLSKYGKKVLVLDKEPKAGGQLSSFKRGDFHFDSSITHLKYMREGGVISPFLKFWDKEVAYDEIEHNFIGVTNGRKYKVRGKYFAEDLIKAFPQDEADIRNYFREVQKVQQSIKKFKTMKPPFEMNFSDKVKFVFDLVTRKRIIAKYTSADYVKTLNKFFKNRELINFIFSILPVASMPAYFQMFTVGTNSYYPTGGMQSMADAFVEVLVENGGQLKLNSEVVEIIIKDGKAIGVKTKSGEEYYGNYVISNVAPHYTFGKLVDRNLASPLLKNMIENRNVFESFCFVYLGMSKDFKLNNGDYLVFPDEVDLSIAYKDYTPDNCPLSLIRYPLQDENQDYALLLAGIIPYDYKDYWGTYGDKKHDEEYRKVKLEVQEKMIDRVAGILGPDFKANIKYRVTGTPLSFERYTNVERGSTMGWSMKGWKVSFNAVYPPYKTNIENMYLVGQFTFPGGGIPGVLTSGYYLACELLGKENIDLAKEIKKFRNLG